MAQLHAELKRVHLEGVNVDAPDEVREWVRQAMASEVLATGELGSQLYFFGDDFLDVVDLAPVEASAPVLAAVFLQLGGRPEIRRRVRAGPCRMFQPDGQLVDAVCLLDVRGEAWCLQWRRRIGAHFEGTWTSEEGQGTDNLRDEVRGWLDSEDVEVDALLGDTRPIDPPEIRAAFLDYQGRIPDTVEELGSLAVWITARDPITVDNIAILVFADLIEQWDVSGELPCSLDDLVRNIAGQGTPKGVAVVRVSAAEVDGRTTRAIRARVEGPDGAAELLIPLQGGALATPISQEPGVVRWLGHPPEEELEMPILGIEGWAGPVAES